MHHLTHGSPPHVISLTCKPFFWFEINSNNNIPILFTSPPTASEGPAHDRQPPRKPMRFADVHAFHHPIHVGSAIKEPPTLE